MISIAMFNNKGGVGKTTLTCNLCAYLAAMGKKVLLVDADAQCNSTINCLSEDAFVNVYYDKEGFTVYDIIKPVKQGVGYVVDIKPYRISNYNIDIIPGDPRFSIFEDTLSFDWSPASSGDERGIRTTMVFKNLVSRLTNYDYVFFDLGPSLGAINRAVLLACDFFITPMSSDIFSVLAVENIGTVLKDWKSEFRIGFERCKDTAFKSMFEPLSDIKFIGYVTQQYTAKKNKDGDIRPVQAFERILKEVPDLIEEELIHKINGDSLSIDYKLGEIPNFSSLIPMSQVAHKPVFSLTSSDGIVGAHFAKVKEFKDTISRISENLLINLEAFQ